MRTDPERFWPKVRITESCWLWCGQRGQGGYGIFQAGLLREGTKRRVRAHRWAYEHLVGPVPDGLVLDHTCHNDDPGCDGGPTCVHRTCVNPDHLEPVSSAVNARRGRTGRWRKAQALTITRCPLGHDYDQANTYTDSRGCRTCRTCHRESQRRLRARRRTQEGQ